MIPQAQIYDFKARMYDPTLGRFLQTDPIGYGSDVNPYAYVGNDPVNGWDPSGLATCFGCRVKLIGGNSTAVQEFVVTALPVVRPLAIDQLASAGFGGYGSNGPSLGGPTGGGKGGGKATPRSKLPNPCSRADDAAASTAGDLPAGTDPNSQSSLTYELGVEQSEQQNDLVAAFALGIGTTIVIIPEVLESIGLRAVAAAIRGRPVSAQVGGASFTTALGVLAIKTSTERITAIKAQQAALECHANAGG